MTMLKPVLAGLAGLATLLASLPALAEPATATRSVNIRSGPGLNYEVVDQLVENEPVDKGNCNADGSWCYIRHEGTNGWVAAVFLRSNTPPPPTTPTTPPPSSGSDYRATVALNVRSGPGSEFSVVDRLASNERVTRGQCSADGNWCYVTHDGANGWVAARFLERIGSTGGNTGGGNPGGGNTGGSGTANAYVATASVNVRSGPGANFSRVDQLDVGERVTRGDCIAGGEWCYINHDGPDGWVAARFLRPASAAPSNPGGGGSGGGSNPPPVSGTVEIGTAIAGMPVRAQPTLFSSTVGRLERGDTIPVVECTGNNQWCRVRGGGIDGWVPGAFLEIRTQQQPAPQPPTSGGSGSTPSAITTRRLNMYARPGSQFSIVGSVPPSTTVYLETCGPAGDWCRITRNGTQGWIEAQYLRLPEEVRPEDTPQTPNSICFTGIAGIEICLSE